MSEGHKELGEDIRTKEAKKVGIFVGLFTIFSVITYFLIGGGAVQIEAIGLLLVVGTIAVLLAVVLGRLRVLPAIFTVVSQLAISIIHFIAIGASMGNV